MAELSLVILLLGECYGASFIASQHWIRLSLRSRHNERDGVSNHQPHHSLFSRLFRRRSKKTSKLRVTALCVGNSPVTSEFPAKMASNAEKVSIWWRHHDGRVTAITWADLPADLYSHKSSLGHKELISKHWIFVHIVPPFPALGLAVSMGCVLGDRIQTETAPKEPMFIKYVESNHNSV